MSTEDRTKVEFGDPGDLGRRALQRVTRLMLEEASRLPDGSLVAAQLDRVAAACRRLMPETAQ